MQKKITKSILSLAYKAIERESFSEDKAVQSAADEAMQLYFKGQLPDEQALHYSNREKEFRVMNKPTKKQRQIYPR